MKNSPTIAEYGGESGSCSVSEEELTRLSRFVVRHRQTAAIFLACLHVHVRVFTIFIRIGSFYIDKK